MAILVIPCWLYDLCTQPSAAEREAATAAATAAVMATLPAAAPRGRQASRAASDEEDEEHDEEAPARRRPPLKPVMLEFASTHVCSLCDGSLAVRRQQDGEVRVRCRACGAYQSTQSVLAWWYEERQSASESASSDG